MKLIQGDCIEEMQKLIDDCGTLIDMQTRDTFDYVSDVCELLNELNDENKELKDKNSQLQETLAFRSNQLALMERLVDDLGSDEMARQMEEILND